MNLLHILTKLAEISEQGLQKEALGFRGMSQFIKPLIKELKADGNKIIRAARPAKSGMDFMTGNIQITKGKPSFTLKLDEKGFPIEYVTGVVGGTSTPSPVAEFLHEFGHRRGAQNVTRSLKEDPNFLGFEVPERRNVADIFQDVTDETSGFVANPTRKLKHIVIPDQPKAVNTLANELLANNTAMGWLRSQGAPYHILRQYEATMQKPFESYIIKAERAAKDDNIFAKKLLQEGADGHTLRSGRPLSTFIKDEFAAATKATEQQTKSSPLSTGRVMDNLENGKRERPMPPSRRRRPEPELAVAEEKKSNGLWSKIKGFLS